MRSFPLRYLTSLPLKYAGDCSLIGVRHHQAHEIQGDLLRWTVYAEEIYGDEGWLAQHALTMTGEFMTSIDEDGGRNQSISPLPLPDDLLKPRPVWNTMKLNYAGPRHRGMREPERLMDILRPISVADKFAIAKRLRLKIAPPMLLGIAESYVLSEALVLHPDVFFVCRRLRLAYALAEPAVDADDEPYDYDTLVTHSAHYYDRDGDGEPALIDALTALPGVELRRPMDCLIDHDTLFIADAARPGDPQPSAIHVWRIDVPDDARHQPSEEERLYG
jgi:hypothetical protein